MTFTRVGVIVVTPRSAVIFRTEPAGCRTHGEQKTAWAPPRPSFSTTSDATRPSPSTPPADQQACRSDRRKPRLAAGVHLKPRQQYRRSCCARPGLARKKPARSPRKSARKVATQVAFLRSADNQPRGGYRATSDGHRRVPAARARAAARQAPRPRRRGTRCCSAAGARSGPTVTARQRPRPRLRPKKSSTPAHPPAPAATASASMTPAPVPKPQRQAAKSRSG